VAQGPGQLLFAGFEGTEVSPRLAELVGAGRLGGVVLFARNLVDPEQAARLTFALHALAPPDAPLVLAIDQEGGRVQRLRDPFTEWPPMRVLGERPVDETAQVARALARELRDLRIDLNFAPVCDVDTNPANPVIGDRSFARAPEAVAERAAAFVRAHEAEGVAACAKHFPGHGDTAQDSHVALPRLEHDMERLRRVELPPFRAAARAGVASVMSAHVVVSCLDPTRPATLCAPAARLLREELGFEGVFFSDDLEMAAVHERYAPEETVREALAAGVDAFLVCRREELVQSVLTELERQPRERLAPALRRVAALKARFAGGRRASGAGPPYPEHRRLAERLREGA